MGGKEACHVTGASHRASLPSSGSVGQLAFFRARFFGAAAAATASSSRILAR
jgi:hypothetical protein